MKRNTTRAFPRTQPLALPSAILIAFAIAAIASIPLPRASARDLPVPSIVHPPTRHALTGGVASLSTPGVAEVLFPRSTFTMGSTVAEVRAVLEACKREPRGAECTVELFEDEFEAHRVTLSPYWLDRTEVTVREYLRCVDAGACASPPFHEGAERFSDLSFPVSLVSWDDARAYCAFIGKQLPTEAQWERAARGLIGRRFPWGNHYASRYANHGSWTFDSADSTDSSDGFLELAPVDSFPHGNTPEQISDMAGNVAEWTLDNYADGYEAGPTFDPFGPVFGAYKTVRGGAYNVGMPWLRGSARVPRKASTRAPFVGFRCARSASGASSMRAVTW